jgi:hypothetical protein
MTARALIVCHDPGGISSLEPLIDALKSFAEVELWLHPLSVSAYRGSCRAITSFTNNDVQSALRAANPDIIITGTSMAPDSIDKKVVDAAWHLGIPSIAFVDFWSNYIERFTHQDGTQIFPDLIATIDDTAKAEMVAAGIPEALIEIVGITRPAPAAAPKSPDFAAFQLLFISQALAEIHGGAAACRARIGYTQQDAFALLAEALPAFEVSLGRRIEISLRHHPKEKAWRPKTPHKLANGLTAEACLANANLVAGMNGSLLIDALFMARPVVSFQPNLKGPDCFMPSRQGYVPLVTRAQDALFALQKAVTTPQIIPPSLAKAGDGQAVTRFSKLIQGMIAETTRRRIA